MRIITDFSNIIYLLDIMMRFHTLPFVKELSMALKNRGLWIGLALPIAALLLWPFTARGGVDPKLVGTWRLQSSAQPIYWEINANGTYSVFGSGVPGHSGTFRAASGKWSLRSPTWGDDGGTYQLLHDDTLTGVGKMGPAIWVRATAHAAVSTESTARTSASPAAQRPSRMTAEDEAAYISDYNAQWDKAAQGLRRLTTRAPHSSGSGGDWIPGPDSSSGSNDNAAAEAAARAEYDQQRAVESRAYWGGSTDDYNRILNGECNSSDNARYGC